MDKVARYTTCPIDAALAIMAGKWKPRLLWKLYRYTTLRYSDLKRALPGITDKMLAQQLRELEADGLVVRTMYPVMPPKVEYTLSPFGQTLAPVIDALAAWSREHESEIQEILTRKQEQYA